MKIAKGKVIRFPTTRVRDAAKRERLLARKRKRRRNSLQKKRKAAEIIPIAFLSAPKPMEG